MLLSLACLGGCAGSRGAELTLVSFAVTRGAYEGIIPEFRRHWQQTHGQSVQIFASYGGSAAQTRAVIDGLDADVVALAMALDVDRIVEAGDMDPDWREEFPFQSTVTRSTVVIVTRPGNPKNIHTWADLTRPGITVITPNPKTSGGARWNFLAIWGSVTQTGGSPEEALALTRGIFEHVTVLPRDAREAADVFFQKGQGDALITYENEVLLARLRGQDLPYVIPEASISIDNPVAIVDANVARKGNQEVAQAFVDFLFSPLAQREFAKVGFRPVNPEVAREVADRFPPVKQLFTVEDLGGWQRVQQQFFADGAIFDQIQTGLAASLG
ncbi:MAG: sulfate ABC transporter substrate-binding protein [Thermostichales cyanobacterium BF4_bins_65]